MKKWYFLVNVLFIQHPVSSHEGKKCVNNFALSKMCILDINTMPILIKQKTDHYSSCSLHPPL